VTEAISNKLWDCKNVTPAEVCQFECGSGAVYTIVASRDTIYAGCQDGHVKVFDLETKTLLRTIIVEEVGLILLSYISLSVYQQP
jgi:di- and tripeptidase